jgi:hypothetical protein
MTTMTSILAAGVLAGACQSSAPDDVRAKVAEVVRRYFPEVDIDRRRMYVERLSGALVSAAPSESATWVLQALPDAASYHADVMAFHKGQFRRYEPPRELLLEGYDIQVAALERRITRALGRDRSESTRTTIASQVEKIFAAAKTELRERLRGEAGENLVERQFESLRRTWLDSLHTPFNSNLERPLAPEELQVVLDHLSGTAQSIPQYVITAELLLNAAWLEKSGIGRHLRDMETATLRATQLSLKHVAHHATAEREWEKRVNEKLKELNEAYRAGQRTTIGEPVPDRTEETRGATADTRAPERPLAPRALRSKGGPAAARTDRAPRIAERERRATRAGLPVALVLGYLLTLAAIVWLTVLRRLPASAGATLGIVVTAAAIGWYSALMRTSSSIPSPDVPSTSAAQASSQVHVDLLQIVDSSKDGWGGKWGFDGDVLVSPAVAFARLYLPCDPLEEYDLELVAERVGGTDSIAIGLAAGSARFVAVIDGYGGKSGLDLLDGKAFIENETTYNGRLFTEGKPSTILCEVRGAGVSVTVDGKRIIDWQSDVGRLSLFPRWKDPQRGPLFIGSWTSPYRIHRVTLKPVSSAGKKPA